MNVQVCGHRLLIKPFNIEEHDEVFAAAKRAGIALLESDARKQQTAVDKGTVLQLGFTAFKAYDDGVPWCSVGDTVAFAKFGGKYIKDPVTKEDYLILNDEDVLCIFKENVNG